MPRPEPPAAGGDRDPTRRSSPRRPPQIAPTTDAAIRAAKALKTSQGRREQHRFLLEGVRLIGDALDQGVPIDHVFITPHLLETTSRGQQLAQWLRDSATPIFEISERLLTLVADTETPAGIVAVAPLPRPLPELPKPHATGLGALLLDLVRDPGNVGGILRSTAAAGIDSVVSTEGSADLWAPKVVRSAAGAHFRLDLWTAQPQAEVATWLQGWRQIVVADGRSPITMYQVDWRLPSVLVLANEAHGPSPWLASLPVVRAAIPMRAETESLNVAAAAAVLLYEARRDVLRSQSSPAPWR